jgi:phage terminase Nu1 subunit (DNA packaging protein)
MRPKYFESIPFLTGERMTKAEIAALLGKPIAEIDGWVRAGAPCQRSGATRSPLHFDSAQLIAWYVIREAAEKGGEVGERIARLEFERDALEAEIERRTGKR